MAPPLSTSRRNAAVKSSSSPSSSPPAATGAVAAVVPPPDEFICPLTLSLMVDPVMDVYGNNFEKSAIMAWLCEKGNTTCPLTRRNLKPRNLAHNSRLKEDIEDWKRENNLPIDCSVPNDDDVDDQENGNDHQVLVYVIMDFAAPKQKQEEQQRGGNAGAERSSSTHDRQADNKRASKARKNLRLSIVKRLQKSLGSKKGMEEETEALTASFLQSLNSKQLAALNVVCEIGSGCDIGHLRKSYSA